MLSSTKTACLIMMLILLTKSLQTVGIFNRQTDAIGERSDSELTVIGTGDRKTNYARKREKLSKHTWSNWSTQYFERHKREIKRDTGMDERMLVENSQRANPKPHLILEQYMRNLTRPVGTKASFYCDILGQPIPVFQWFRNDKKISENSERIRIETGLWGSSLRVEQIKKSDEGTYVCMATNPFGTVNATATLRVLEKSPDGNAVQQNANKERTTEPGPEADGFCQEFHSNVCGKYLFGHKVYVTREYQQALIETQISKFLKLTATQILHRIREDCLKHLMEAVCYYNFPVCIPVQQQDQFERTNADPSTLIDVHRPIHLCRQDCNAVMDDECSATYKYLDRTIMHEVPDLIMDCSSLPVYSYEKPTGCRSLGQHIPNFIEERSSTNDAELSSIKSKETKADLEITENKRLDLTDAFPSGPDLVPLFISVGVLLLMSFVFLIFCLFCRRTLKRSSNSGSDIRMLFTRRRREFGLLNGSNGISSRGQEENVTKDLAANQKNHLTRMNETIKLSKIEHLLSDQEVGYTMACSPRANKFISQSNSSNNLISPVAPISNGPNSLSSGPNSQIALVADHVNSSSNSGFIANSNMKNGTVVTYYQYQPPTCMLPPLPPPSAPAPPPPPPLTLPDFQLIGQNSLNVGNPNIHLTFGATYDAGDSYMPYNGNCSDSQVTNFEGRKVGFYEHSNNTESPTAYTTLRDSGSNGYCVSQSSVSMIRLTENNCDGVTYSKADLGEPGSNLTEYSLTQLRFGKQFGQGVFGPVYKAELIHSIAYPNDSSTHVIVKTLSAGSPASLQAEFRREAELISELDHPNVLSLFGVSLQNPPWCMIFEVHHYMDLCELLSTRRAADNSTALPEQQFTYMSPLSDIEKLHILGQVAAGMDYLSSHRFVHRDLAARNVLVLNDQLFSKITDLGLARDCYANDYYRTHPHSLMLPIRWMPIDSIVYGKFTAESDIWAFGVLMWEVWSGGMRPYAQYSDIEVLDLIRTRQLLSMPLNCHAEVYGFMLNCWMEETDKRPSFKDCLYQISRWQYNISSSGVLRLPTSTSSPVSFSSNCRRATERMQEHESQNTDKNNVHNTLPFSYLSIENPELFASNEPVWMDSYANQQIERKQNFINTRFSPAPSNLGDSMHHAQVARTKVVSNGREQSSYRAGNTPKPIFPDASPLGNSNSVYVTTVDSVL